MLGITGGGDVYRGMRVLERATAKVDRFSGAKNLYTVEDQLIVHQYMIRHSSDWRYLSFPKRKPTRYTNRRLHDGTQLERGMRRCLNRCRS